MDVSSLMGHEDTRVSAPKPMTHKEADRLDVMLEIVFRYTYDVCHNKNGTPLLFRLNGLCRSKCKTLWAVLRPGYCAI